MLTPTSNYSALIDGFLPFHTIMALLDMFIQIHSSKALQASREIDISTITAQALCNNDICYEIEGIAYMVCNLA